MQIYKKNAATDYASQSISMTMKAGAILGDQFYLTKLPAIE